MKTAVKSSAFRILLPGLLPLPTYKLTTQADAASSTTVVKLDDATGVSGGMVAEFHSGNNQGVKRLVKSLSTKDLTIDASPVAAADGDSVKIADNPCFFLDDTGGSATKVVDATHAEAVDYFKGAMVEGVATTNNNNSYDITASSAAGELTAALTGNTAAGDVYLPYVCEEGSISVDIEPQSIDRGNYGGLIGAIGKYAAAIYDSKGSVDISVKKLPVRALSGVTAQMCPFGWIFGSGLRIRRGKGSDITGAASTTSKLDITEGEGSNFSAGDIIAIAGEITQIEQVVNSGTPDELHVLPALSAIPTEGVDVVAGLNLAPVLDGEGYLVGLSAFTGDFEETIAIGRCGLKSVSGERGKIVTAQGDFIGGYSFLRPTTRNYKVKFFDSGLIISHSTRVRIDGTYFNELQSFAFNPNIDLGKNYGLNCPDGVADINLTDSACTLQLTLQLNATSYATLKAIRESKKVVNVTLQIGDCDTNGGMAICLHNAQLSALPEFPDSEGVHQLSLTFSPVIDSSYLDCPAWGIAIF